VETPAERDRFAEEQNRTRPKGMRRPVGRRVISAKPVDEPGLTAAVELSEQPRQLGLVDAA
jgi:hypothetical protein